MTQFPDRLRLPLTFDPVLLARDLDDLCSDEWVSHYVKQNYDGDWSVGRIVRLRAPFGDGIAGAGDQVEGVAALQFYRRQQRRRTSAGGGLDRGGRRCLAARGPNARDLWAGKRSARLPAAARVSRRKTQARCRHCM